MGKILVVFTFIYLVFGRQIVLANPTQIKVGDVLLLDLDCPSCQAIEDETFGPYSHSGVVIEVEGELMIAQSLQYVHYLRPKTFYNFSNKPILHLRPKNITDDQRKTINLIYFNQFHRVPFDHSFTWGNDSYYCSEFIYKLLARTIKFKSFGPKKMNYLRNWDFWNDYFNHIPPQDQPGLSPNDFMRSSDFYKIGYL